MKIMSEKWFKCYLNIVERAQIRGEVTAYTEKHHIIPKSFGGTNSKENLARLTAREHLIAHKLLVKFLGGEERKVALRGLWAMAVLKNKHTKNKRKKLNSREFEKLRIEYFQSRKNVPLNQETKNKISATLTGRKITKSTIDKRTKTLQQNLESGKTKIVRPALSAVQKENMQNKMQFTKSQWSDEKRKMVSQKLGASNRGKKRSVEQCKKISDGIKNSNYKPSKETRQKISNAQIGKIKQPCVELTLLTPSGEIIKVVEKVHAFCKLNNIGVKYLYLSLKNNLSIQKGKGKGWQLLFKQRF